MLASERLQRLEEIFHSARKLDSETRTEFVQTSCGGDETLLREVEALLRSDESAMDFIERLPTEFATSVIATAEDDLPAGRIFGHYEILERIGSGGMGDVYCARDVRSGRKAALKLLPPPFAIDADRFRRFQQEARTVIALNHPNIVTIYEIGEEGGAHYIVSELIEGETLRAQLQRGPLPVERALDIAMQVCGALIAAHKAGVVHRDIKPENIMLREDGYAKVLDFGIAKLAAEHAGDASVEREIALSSHTIVGARLGTLRYMSPEQVRGDEVDARSDLWSLGVVLHEMISGVPAFSGTTAGELSHQILEQKPSTAADPSLQGILQRALAKDPSQRFASAVEFREALNACRRGREIKAAPSSRVWGTAAAAAVFLLVAAAFVVSRSHRGVTSADGRQKAIVVLPFESAGSGTEDDYLRFGLADALAARLGHVDELLVRPSSSVRKLNEAATDPLAAGRKLEADLVVHGSMQKSGNRIRLNVQLLNVATRAVIWSESFNQDFTDIFDVQDAISTRVMSALPLRLTSAEQAQLRKRYTDNVEAYQLYLQGRYLSSQLTAESLQKATHAFEKAAAIDPNYALAYAGLADAYGYYAVFEGKPEFVDRARAAAKRALELDDQLSETHVVLGNVALLDYDWAGAEREFRRAIELFPGDAFAHFRYAKMLIYLRRAEEGLRELARAQEIDPTYVWGFEIPHLYTTAGRPEQAIAYAKNLLEVHPDSVIAHMSLGDAYLAKQMRPEAAAAYEQTVSLADSHPLAEAMRAIAAALRGRTEEARTIVHGIEERRSTEFVWPCDVAAIYDAIGDKDAVIAWLERAYQEHDPNLRGLSVYFPDLRDDPRYTDLLDRLHLPH